MRFQVPQFIEVEDKIFRSLTLKQGIYLAGGVGLSFVIYRVLGSFVLAGIPILLVMALTAALTWWKINQRFSFIYYMEAAFKYFFSSKLYIWKKEATVKPPATAEEEAAKMAGRYASVMVPKISNSKLKDLTWSLDIKESMYTNKNQK